MEQVYDPTSIWYTRVWNVNNHFARMKNSNAATLTNLGVKLLQLEELNEELLVSKNYLSFLVEI